MEGHAFRLRPAGDGDAGFIAGLRSDPALNRYLHETSGLAEDQLAWLARYYERAGDFYFVVEHKKNRTAEGVISLYGIDASASAGEWGRWILRKGSLAAVESAWLIYITAFEILGLESVYCRTVADNGKVVSFHDSCGISKRRVLRGHFHIGGRKFDAIEHRVDRRDWGEIAPRLEALAKMTARRIARG